MFGEDLNGRLFDPGYTRWLSSGGLRDDTARMAHKRAQMALVDEGAAPHCAPVARARASGSDIRAHLAGASCDRRVVRRIVILAPCLIGIFDFTFVGHA